MKKISFYASALLAMMVMCPQNINATTTSMDTIMEQSENVETGIHFLHDSWAELVKKAKSENKLIFIDFYTQWCGPCMNMATTVFTLPQVGDFYNKNFICAKIDAENGEGIELAKKYGVRSYPTYAFVDPTTEQMIHRSGSRQTPEQFIYTGKSAIDPTLRSFYLEEQYQKGNRERKFLINYIKYNHSVYASKNVTTAFDELIKSGAKLTDNDVWNVYVETISGINKYLKEVSSQYTEFCNKFGKKEVDAKLAKETTYGDLQEIESLCDFEGKAFNCELIRINNAINKTKNYDEAISRIDAMIANPQVNQQALIQRLKFMVRVNYYGSDSMPEKWFNKCVEYLRYIAYNQTDRDDANIHQEYADALEKLLKRLPEKDGVPSALLSEPMHGKKEYSMRPDALKPKPGIKRTKK